MMRRASTTQLERPTEVARKFQGERAGGEGSGRWTAGLNCQSRL